MSNVVHTAVSIPEFILLTEERDLAHTHHVT